MCEWQAFVFTSRASWGKEKHDIYLIPHLLIKMEFPCLLNFLPHGVHSKELTIYPFVLSRTSDDFANPATIEHKSLRSHAGTLWLNHTMTWGSLRSGNAQTANGRGLWFGRCGWRQALCKLQAKDHRCIHSVSQQAVTELMPALVLTIDNTGLPFISYLKGKTRKADRLG